MRMLALLCCVGGTACATAHVQGSTHIARTPEEVFDTVADQRNEPQYNPEMEQVELLTPEPPGAGSRFKVQVRSRGDLIPMTVEYTEFQRPHRLGSRTTTESMDIAGTLTCTPDQGGTRLAWDWELKP
ncbi:MAG: SRPBCC family protein [Deltaproteobacteria bacterium]|nr:SRPBCC family protein [Deltaproteobacteria bacterium]